MSSFPDRCRSCVQWLGHDSGNREDVRCNRTWGHGPGTGDFLVENQHPSEQPSYVEPRCRVPVTDVATPYVNPETGYQEPAPRNWRVETVDAYIPLASLDGIPRVQFGPGPDAPFVDPEELADILNTRRALGPLFDMNKKLADLHAGRKTKRDTREKELAAHYKKEFGTAPRLVSPADLPPWASFQERIPTGNAVLDWKFRGGYPVGTRLTLGGKPNAGKSTLQQILMGAHIRYYLKHSHNPEDERFLGYFTEGFDPFYFSMITGIPVEIVNRHVVIATDDMLESFLQKIVESAHGDNADFSEFHTADIHSYDLPISYRYACIDSWDSSTYKDEILGKNNEIKKIEKANRVGGRELLLSEFFRKGYAMSKVPMTAAWIAQDRTTGLGTQFVRTKYQRGTAHGYFDQLELYAMRENPNTEGAKKKSTTDVRWRVDKIKFGANLKDGDTFLLPMRDQQGFRQDDAAVQMALDPDIGVIAPLKEKSSQWFLLDANGNAISVGGEEVKGLGMSDPAKIADRLGEMGLIPMVYDLCMKRAGLEIESPFVVDEPMADAIQAAVDE